MLSFGHTSPDELSGILAQRVRARRLEHAWSREELSARSGVALATLRKFEETGSISLGRLLRLLDALGALDEMARVLAPANPTRGVGAFEAFEAAVPRQRGRTTRPPRQP
ncbi:hypothetical protein rosag_47580 [Roseisolibacter agri]|uniref:HTH cro/C1-type domain-containing protein n=2 Tax=Roseisolibacter agri TaxID=2014610 RepID=A0AA37QKJ6_9BACT|nr:hypothetical protein rosag_47580 [Roseisolibacter agri]